MYLLPILKDSTYKAEETTVWRYVGRFDKDEVICIINYISMYI